MAGADEGDEFAEISYQDSNRTIYFEKTATSGSAADISFRLLDGGNLRVVSDAAAAWGSTYDTELASKTYVDEAVASGSVSITSDAWVAITNRLAILEAEVQNLKAAP